ncbi:unnamed protein product [Zymoseptoria tritici ST99CH_1A5]|uniref:Uncharacterized protein n=1 Tax=Zymoseptoria tritici ST99CH_1A5 TaxID=1276529 RepID=A0A1Y6L3K2_ZYMTR|nr:unnamed protein product [Zymoseptoria tritici ST99CH_1A5]
MSSLWSCAVRPCTTGQTIHPRPSHGRKFVSDFFGRNKTSTLSIPEDVWHYYCRQHYQRMKYAADKSPAAHLQFFSDALRAQLQRIKLWRPEAKFTVQLQSAAGDRLSKYEAELLRNGNDRAAAKNAVSITPRTGKKNGSILSSANAVEVEHAAYVRDHLAGENRSVDWILANVMPWIEGEFVAGRMVRMPPVEFLVGEVREGEVVHAVQGNWAAWDAAFPVGGGGGSGASAAATVGPAAGGIAVPPGSRHTAEEVAAANALLDLFSAAPRPTMPPPLPLYVPPPPVSREQPAPPTASPPSVLDLPHVSAAQPPLPSHGWRKHTRRAVYIRGMLFSKAVTRFWHPDVEQEYTEWPLKGDETEPETEVEDEESGKEKRKRDLEEDEDDDDDDDVFKPKGKAQKL